MRRKSRATEGRSFGVAGGLAVVSGALLLTLLVLDSALEAATTDSFCLSCHEMAVNIGGEYEHRLRLPGSEERHATCAECHLPQDRLSRMRRKLRAGRELYHHLIGTVATPARFEARRMAMAGAVWRDLQRSGSGECTICHDDDGERESASAAARSYHERALVEGVACTGCHKGVAHAIRPPPPGEEGHGEPAACLGCHEPERVEAIWRASHSDPAALGETPPSGQCGDCHGAGSAHRHFPLPWDGAPPGAASAAEGAESQACIECHREGPRAEWEVRAHGFSETACGSCHRIHPAVGAMRSASGADAGCTESCHTRVAEMGRVVEPDASSEATCTSCHDPHLPPETSRCESCHRMDRAALDAQSPEARGLHERGVREQIHCGDCHKGMIHESPHVELMNAGPLGS
ncbi:MAG: hypothetical protein CL910_00265 [Deltaproteobacteria bacterium]|jgi:nitrate/TMAO reductase-like tetraheme cytochrome c subunit|nr:hypothetical protein [Deltaproteobacteria bacterium]